ncbi:MAG: RNA 2'-phosphotransferase [Bacteroidales bacterium]|nr:RNA 2'-phosphotransferase [Bacteroidales bacterium]
MEDYFDRMENGHVRTDCYDRVTNTLDISFGDLYPSCVLSNSCDNNFLFDGVYCGSMEGFLQSLKYSDPLRQVQICACKGGLESRMSHNLWISEQRLWWKGEALERQSDAYQHLLFRAYKSLFDQNQRFRVALLMTIGRNLSHIHGPEDPTQTVLTASEFCSILTEIRDNSRFIEEYNTDRSRKLAFLLRHDRKYKYDEHGWRDVEDLVSRYGFTLEELCVIVCMNNKQRFEFSDDLTHIRARQGHSVQVDVELRELIPPDILYHGTAVQNVESILREGIVKGNRLYVHLSSSTEVAMNVGQRHGDPVVLTIDSKSMREAGKKFYLSRNGVWLTEFVAPMYIKQQ